MISLQERAAFERIIIPLAFCEYQNGTLHTVLVTDGMCKVVNSKREPLIDDFNNRLYDAVHKDDVQWLKDAVISFAEKNSEYLDVVCRNKSRGKDEFMLLHVVGRWQRLEDGSEVIVLGFNDMKRTQNAFGDFYNSVDQNQSNLLLVDTVTKLPSFHYMRQFAQDRIQNIRLLEQKPVLVFFDVKSMHSYNQSYGYEKGDDLIRLIGSKIADAFPDALFGRGVDDHFILIDSFHGQNDLTDKITEINRAVRDEAYGSADGISAGIYVVEPDVSAVQALDFARQAIKEIGSDLNSSYSFFTREKSDRFWKERYIIENFESAIENGWIRVFYQAIVDSKTREVASLEALARWIDPDLSHYRQLHRLDLYMAEQVCKEFELRKEAGLAPIPVSVNFSARDFDCTDVAQQLKNITEKFGIAPEKLVVEITEQDSALGEAHVREQLEQIRTNGHPLWVDDFGSGYSSLNVLGRYNADRIKFDLELLKHLDENNGANRRMMKAVVNVCKELGIHTLAEGVETEEQLLFLQEIDCEMAQGFYLYKPESLTEIKFKIQQQGYKG